MTAEDNSRALGALADQVDQMAKQQRQDRQDISRLSAALEGLSEAIGALSGTRGTNGGSRPSEWHTGPPGGISDPPVEWLTIPDPVRAGNQLYDLDQWRQEVLVHYGVSLPSCWFYHPGAVSELTALWSAWLAATAEDAKPTALADWHERYLPGVIRRVAKQVTCHDAPGAHRAGYAVEDRPDVRAIGTWWVLTRGREEGEIPGLLPAVAGGRLAVAGG